MSEREEAVTSLVFDATQAKKGAEEFARAGQAVVDSNKAVERSEEQAAAAVDEAETRKTSSRKRGTTARQQAATQEVSAERQVADAVEQATQRKAQSYASVERVLQRAAREYDPLNQAVRDRIKEVERLQAIEARGGDQAARAAQLLVGAQKRLETAQKAAASAASQSGNAFRLQGYQITNVSYQLQDMAVQLAGGQNPFLVMMQQGPQAVDAMGGLKNSLTAVGQAASAAWAFIRANPFLILAGAVTTAATAALVYLTRVESLVPTQDEMNARLERGKRAYEGMATASGAMLRNLEAQRDNEIATAQLTVDRARERVRQAEQQVEADNKYGTGIWGLIGPLQKYQDELKALELDLSKLKAAYGQFNDGGRQSANVMSEQAAAAVGATRSVDDLIASYDQAAAIQKQVVAAEYTLNKAVSEGKRTRAEANEILSRYRASLEAKTSVQKEANKEEERFETLLRQTLPPLEQGLDDIRELHALLEKGVGSWKDWSAALDTAIHRDFEGWADDLAKSTKQMMDKVNAQVGQELGGFLKRDGSDDSQRRIEQQAAETLRLGNTLGSVFDRIAFGSMDSILDGVDQLTESFSDLSDKGLSFSESLSEIGKGLMQSARAGSGLANLIGSATGRSDAQNRNGNIAASFANFLPKEVRGPAAFFLNLFGGLFGPGRSVGPISNAAVGFNTDIGRLDVLDSRADNGGDRQGAARAARTAISTVDQILEDFGGSLTAVYNHFRIGENKNGFFVTRNSNDGLNQLSPDDITGLDTIEDAMAVVVQRLIDGTYGAVEGVSDRLRRVMAQAQGRPLDQLMEELERLQKFEDFTGPLEPLTETGQALKDLAAATREATRFATEYGEDLSLVTQAEQRRIQVLRDAYTDSVQADIYAYTGRGYLNEVRNLQTTRDTRRRDAADLGISAAGADQAFVLGVQALIDNSQLVGTAFQDLVSVFPELTGQVHAFTAATEEAAAVVRSAAEIASEREGLERQLLALQGNTVEIRRRERDALDATNRVLYDQIQTLQDAAAVATERDGLERELLQLQGNTTELRRREREALDASNRALYDQIQTLRDQQEQAERTRQAMDSVGTMLANLRVSVRDYLNQSAVGDLSSLNPLQKQQRAQADFAAQLALARAGNQDAIGSITQYADRLKQAEAAYSGTSSARFAATEQMIAQALTGLPDQVDVQQAILQQLQAMTGDIQDALTVQTAAITARLAVLSADIDRNGSIDRSEFTTWGTANQAAIAALAGVVGVSNGNLVDIFTALDTNGDGQLTQLELIAANTNGTAVGIARFNTVLSTLTTDNGFPVLRQIRDALTLGQFSTAEADGTITTRYGGANDTLLERIANGLAGGGLSDPILTDIRNALTTEGGWPVLRQIRDLLAYGQFTTRDVNGNMLTQLTGSSDTVLERLMGGGGGLGAGASAQLERIAKATEITAQVGVATARAQRIDIGRTFGADTAPTANVAANVAAVIRTAFEGSVGGFNSATGNLTGSLTQWLMSASATAADREAFNQIVAAYGQGSRAIPAYASGTDDHPGGLAYVHAGELIEMPERSRVYTRAETERMLSRPAAGGLSEQALARGLAQVASVIMAEGKATRAEARALRDAVRDYQSQLKDGFGSLKRVG